jgi:hypothetical protein
MYTNKVAFDILDEKLMAISTFLYLSVSITWIFFCLIGLSGLIFGKLIALTEP